MGPVNTLSAQGLQPRGTPPFRPPPRQRTARNRSSQPSALHPLRPLHLRYSTSLCKHSHSFSVPSETSCYSCNSPFNIHSIAVMPVQDRTNEFRACVESIRNRSSLPPRGSEAKQRLLQSQGKEGDGKSEFTRMANAIAKDISSTGIKLGKLAQCK